jgi:hypothetical protein
VVFEIDPDDLALDVARSGAHRLKIDKVGFSDLLGAVQHRKHQDSPV